MFKLVHYEARTVGKWAVDILLERSSVFFYVHSVFQNLPYVADKSGEKQNFLHVSEKLENFEQTQMCQPCLSISLCS